MTKKASILVVDDEHAMRDFLSASMASRYRVRTAHHGEEAIAILKEQPFDLVLSDVRMPGGDGLGLLARIQNELTDPPLVVMMTAFGTIKEAVEATKRGAVDYLTKPFGMDQLEHTLARVFELKALRQENRSLRSTLRIQREQNGLLGASEPMVKMRERIEMIADSRGTVLLQGESGTGKEVVARAIHLGGGRRGAPFIRLNCAAIPESLLEGELFGYERGAFTGAVQARAGKFELADGGTLLLDEISEIPVSMQAKLLRVLQEREISRLGSRAATQGGRARHRHHQPRPQGGDPREAFPRGPVLSPQRHPALDRAASPAQGGHPGPRRPFRAPFLRRERQTGHDDQRARDAGADESRVAGQRAAVAERDRARRHHEHRDPSSIRRCSGCPTRSTRSPARRRHRRTGRPSGRWSRT